MSDDKTYKVQVIGCMGGPVLLCFLTSSLYRLTAPQVLEREFHFTHFLWPAFCGFWLGSITGYLFTDKDELSKRIKTVRGNVVPISVFSCFFLFERRDRIIEYLPGPALILIWCALLMGLCFWMHKEARRKNDITER